MPAQQLDMSVHLQGFVNSVRDLPAELQRCFTMIAQLDQKCHMLKEDVDKAAMEELQKVACQVGLRISEYWAETVDPPWHGNTQPCAGADS